MSTNYEKICADLAALERRAALEHADNYYSLAQPAVNIRSAATEVPVPAAKVAAEVLTVPADIVDNNKGNNNKNNNKNSNNDNMTATNSTFSPKFSINMIRNCSIRGAHPGRATTGLCGESLVSGDCSAGVFAQPPAAAAVMGAAPRSDPRRLEVPSRVCSSASLLARCGDAPGGGG